MCSLAAGGAPFLAEPASDLEAQQKEQRGKEKITMLWMLTMSLLWLGGFWACVWTQAPQVGMATSFEQEWRAVKGLPRLFLGEVARRLGLPTWAVLSLLLAMGSIGALAWFGCGLSKAVKRLKNTAHGVFVMHRLLPLLDIGSDVAITCRLWGTDYWWSRLSLFFIANSFVATFVLAAPVFEALLAQNGVLLPLACWTVVGLPCSTLVGPVSMMLYPCKDPDRGWLAKVLRLQKVVEVFLEAPSQALLQLWMVLTEVALALEEGREHRKFPITLVASLFLSLLNIKDAVEDTRATAKAQEMGFFEALWEELLVGLNRRAPLLPVMRFQTHVSWAGEGLLTEEHCKQIGQQLHQSPNVEVLHFANDNALSVEGAKHLAEAAWRLKVGLQGSLYLTTDGFEDRSAEGAEILAVGMGRDTRLESWSFLSKLKDAQRLLVVIDPDMVMDEHCQEIGEQLLQRPNLQVLLSAWDSILSVHGAKHLLEAAVRQDVGSQGALHLATNGLKDGILTVGVGRDTRPENWNFLARFKDARRLMVVSHPAVDMEEHCKEIGKQLKRAKSLKALCFAQGGAIKGLGASHLAKAALKVFAQDRLKVELQGLDRTVRLAVDGDIGSLKDESAEGVEILAVGLGGDTRPESWSCLAGFTGIKFFMLANGRYVNNMNAHCKQIVEHVAKCRGLQRLVVTTLMEWQDVAVLATAADGQRFQLEVEGVWVPPQSGLRRKDWEKLVARNSLQHLVIGSGNDVGSRCSELAALDSLKHLEVGAHNDVGTEGCWALTALHSLEHLEIGNHNYVGAEGCKALAALPSLQHLEIGHNNDVDAEGCRALATLPSLQYFSISSVRNSVSRQDLEAFRCEVHFY